METSFTPVHVFTVRWCAAGTTIYGLQHNLQSYHEGADAKYSLTHSLMELSSS
jgi:hypothetical protein